MVMYGGSDDGDCNDACKDAGGGGDEYGDEISYDMLAPRMDSVTKRKQIHLLQ